MRLFIFKKKNNNELNQSLLSGNENHIKLIEDEYNNLPDIFSIHYFNNIFYIYKGSSFISCLDKEDNSILEQLITKKSINALDDNNKYISKISKSFTKLENNLVSLIFGEEFSIKYENHFKSIKKGKLRFFYHISNSHYFFIGKLLENFYHIENFTINLNNDPNVNISQKHFIINQLKQIEKFNNYDILNIKKTLEGNFNNYNLSKIHEYNFSKIDTKDIRECLGFYYRITVSNYDQECPFSINLNFIYFSKVLEKLVLVSNSFKKLNIFEVIHPFESGELHIISNDVSNLGSFFLKGHDINKFGPYKGSLYYGFVSGFIRNEPLLPATRGVVFIKSNENDHFIKSLFSFKDLYELSDLYLIYKDDNEISIIINAIISIYLDKFYLDINSDEIQKIISKIIDHKIKKDEILNITLETLLINNKESKTPRRYINYGNSKQIINILDTKKQEDGRKNINIYL